MNLKKIGLFDTSFGHHPLNTVPGNTSQFIEWNRSDPLSEKFVCFTNEKIVDENRFKVENQRRVALLYESRDTMNWLYEQARECISDYHLFFTHEKRFLDSFANTRWIPGNGIWIGNPYGGGEIGIAAKDRMTSFITSSKQTTALQRFRVRLAKTFEVDKKNPVDVYLRSSYAFEYIPISLCLQRYRFSIVIENTQSPMYFTEKLLNCFATGTIPIYLGATEIDRFFDSDGVISFSSQKQLFNEIMPMLSEELYTSKLTSVNTNLSLSQNYESIEKVVSTYL